MEVTIGEFAGMPLITDYPTTAGTAGTKPERTLIPRAERFDPNSGVIEEYWEFETIQEMFAFCAAQNDSQRSVGYPAVWQTTILDTATGDTFSVATMMDPCRP